MQTVSAESEPGDASTVPYRLTDLARYFLVLGTVGFGGPIALAGYMQRDLVERRRWIAREDYLQGLALAQLAPGPLAAQLAMYLGWVRGRVFGAALIGVAFVLPSFLMVLVISALYLEAGGLPWMQSAFRGIGAAVIAIIARSAWKLLRMSLGHDAVLWGVFAVSAVTTAWLESELVALFLGAGVLVMLVRAPPRFLKRGAPGGSLGVVVPIGLSLGSGAVTAAAAPSLWTLALFFAEAGAFVFGSGLAIVPFLHSGVVQEHGWLTEQQFLDAVAVAMITPGPVVITVAFIGYLVAGPLGATVAALATFLPCWVFTVVPAPYFRKLAKNPSLAAFVAGVTAAATGAIAGAAFVLGRRALVDLPTVAIALATLFVIIRMRRLPEPIVILAAGAIGLALWR